MSKQNWKPEPMKKRPEWLSTEFSPKLIITDDMSLKIKYLCQKIHREEWSGVLFFSIEEGSIKDPNNLVLMCRDVLPMDRGTSAATAYSFDERVSSYIMTNAMQNPESMSWKMGHIHSHNSMNVFFSGTDRSELEDNSLYHNFYVSLVVNNYSEYVAKIVFRGKTKITEIPYTCLDENGEPYDIISNNPIENEIMFDMDCKIESPVQNILVGEEFAGRVSRIIQLADERDKQLRANAAKQAQVRPSTHHVDTHGDWRGVNYGKEFNWGPDGEKTSQFGIKTSHKDTKVIETIESAEDFTVFLLMKGRPSLDEDSDIVDAFAELELMMVDLKVHAEEIIADYYAFYSDYFNITPENEDEDHFFTALNSVIEQLENVPEDWNTKPFLNSFRDFQKKVAKKVLQRSK